MRRFDARRQNENETLVEYEQALRMLHREVDTERWTFVSVAVWLRHLWQQCCCYLLLHYFSFYEIYDDML